MGAGRSSLVLALSMSEAAKALGVSPGFFVAHLAPELRVVRRARRTVTDLRRWLDENAAMTLQGVGM